MTRLSVCYLWLCVYIHSFLFIYLFPFEKTFFVEKVLFKSIV